MKITIEFDKKQFGVIENMSIILDRVKQELTEIKNEAQAIDASFDLLIGEVRKLIAIGDITGADELLAEAAEVKHELQESVRANTELAAEVDAANG